LSPLNATGQWSGEPVLAAREIVFSVKRSSESCAQCEFWMSAIAHVSRHGADDADNDDAVIEIPVRTCCGGACRGADAPTLRRNNLSAIDGAFQGGMTMSSRMGAGSFHLFHLDAGAGDPVKPAHSRQRRITIGDLGRRVNIAS